MKIRGRHTYIFLLKHGDVGVVEKPMFRQLQQGTQFPNATMRLFYRLFAVAANAARLRRGYGGQATTAPNFTCLAEASRPGRFNP